MSSLEDTLTGLLPGRVLTPELRTCRDHEHRAALICALTALTVTTGEYVALGDPFDGDIILPPRLHWGASARGGDAWMTRALRALSEATTRTTATHGFTRTVLRGPTTSARRPCFRPPGELRRARFCCAGDGEGTDLWIPRRRQDLPPRVEGPAADGGFHPPYAFTEIAQRGVGFEEGNLAGARFASPFLFFPLRANQPAVRAPDRVGSVQLPRFIRCDAA